MAQFAPHSSAEQSFFPVSPFPIEDTSWSEGVTDEISDVAPLGEAEGENEGSAVGRLEGR